MGIDSQQLIQYVITPTLKEMELYSPAAVVLLLGTATIESNCGQYIHQLRGGCALGIYQMEPRTHDDIWCNFLAYKKSRINLYAAQAAQCMIEPNQLVWDLRYATMMTRFHYLRAPAALPDANDAKCMAEYHKKYYNTMAGKTEVEKSIPIFESIIKTFIKEL